MQGAHLFGALRRLRVERKPLIVKAKSEPNFIPRFQPQGALQRADRADLSNQTTDNGDSIGFNVQQLLIAMASNLIAMASKPNVWGTECD